MLNRRFSMTRVVAGALVFGLPLFVLAQDDADPRKPVWAYAITPEMPVADVRGPQPRPARVGGPANGQAAPAKAPAPPDPTLYSLLGSKFQFTMPEIRSTAEPVDWFPDEHPPLPEIVKHGRLPVVRACWSCHTLNGKGKPENAPVAGLPKDYIVRQLQEFKNGVRDTADVHKPKDMRGITQGMTEADMEQAAGYFAAMPWTPWIRVVEADVIPKVRMAGQAFHLVDDGTTETLGARIVEANEHEAEERLRSPHAGWVAYVPVGAIKKGEVLVTTGGGKTVPCITCHGQDLRGIGTIPGIAGRGPSYLARQRMTFRRAREAGVLATHEGCRGKAHARRHDQHPGMSRRENLKSPTGVPADASGTRVLPERLTASRRTERRRADGADAAFKRGRQRGRQDRALVEQTLQAHPRGHVQHREHVERIARAPWRAGPPLLPQRALEHAEAPADIRIDAVQTPSARQQIGRMQADVAMQR